MPDAGDHDTEHARRGPSRWGDAFAALPQGIPDADGWQRLQARLPAQARPHSLPRWPLWLAAAASLLLALAIPLQLPPAEPGPVRPMVQASSGAAAIAHATATTTVAEPAVAIDARAAQATTVASQPGMPPPRRQTRGTGGPADAARIAAAAHARADLEPLYAQSAQLEALLAMARDERVASGTSAALTEELDRRVAAIDATLIQPELSPRDRADLWGQRVDALRQLVGIEATNRLYAARGLRHDAALVSID